MKKILLSKIVKQVGLLFAITLCSTISYAQDTIKTSGFTFVPDSLVITVGDSVYFSDIGTLHPLVFNKSTTDSFKTPAWFVFDTVGIDNFYCANHVLLGMKGVIDVQSATGINYVNRDNFQLTISPNPFYEYTTLKIKSSGQKINSFKVHNVIGKEIVSYDLSDKNNTLSYKINFSGLEPGVYFCSIYTEMGLIETKKLVLLK
ncbi:MAG: T9SS type A sorting domain-containing protein [Cytophagales bacterium]|nr:T9SS type A sorting domain-containing protein [Cytophagales bacterium]